MRSVAASDHVTSTGVSGWLARVRNPPNVGCRSDLLLVEGGTV